MTSPDQQPVSATLGEYLANLSANADNLRIDVHNAERARRRANSIGLALMAVLTVLMAAVLVVAAQNNNIASQTRKTNDDISSCTTPTGACYRQGSTRTADAIGSILRAEIALGECSRLYPNESGPAYDAKLRLCVYQRIATDPGPVIPSPAPTK